MPSTKKTEHLGLNLWEESDRPMRNDFNSDNRLLDSAIGAHIGNGDIHITSDEKKHLANLITVKAYSGTGESTKTVTLTDTFRFIMVFAKDKPALSSSKVYCAFGYVGQGAGEGLSLSASGTSFTVSQGDSISLNESGTQYRAILFK